MNPYELFNLSDTVGPIKITCFRMASAWLPRYRYLLPRDIFVTCVMLGIMLRVMLGVMLGVMLEPT